MNKDDNSAHQQEVSVAVAVAMAVAVPVPVPAPVAVVAAAGSRQGHDHQDHSLVGGDQDKDQSQYGYQDQEHDHPRDVGDASIPLAGSDTSAASASSSDVTQNDLDHKDSDPVSSHHYNSYSQSSSDAHNPRPLPLRAAPKQDSSSTTETPPTFPRNVPHPRPQARSQTLPSSSRPPPTPPAKPIKRKPLSTTASPLAIRFSQSSFGLGSPVDLPKPDQRFARPFTLDSPTIYEFTSDTRGPKSPSTIETLESCDNNRDFSNVDRSQPRNISTTITREDDNYRLAPAAPLSSPSDTTDVLSGYDDLISDLKSDSGLDITPETVLEESDNDKESIEPESDYDYPYGYEEDESDDSDAAKEDRPQSDEYAVPDTDPTSPMFASKPPPPHLKLEPVDTSTPSQNLQSPVHIDTPKSAAPGVSPKLNKPLPKSPRQSSPFATLFSWAAPSPSGTEFSSLESPVSPSKGGLTNDTRYSTTSNLLSGGPKDHTASTNALGYCESYLSTPPPSTLATLAQVEEMEDDLKAISAELASSIRREIDLEDLVERLQDQINNPQAPGKRTSDYFSDSGHSTAKKSDYEQSRDELEKIQRRSEQEKAQLRLELNSKLQDERSRRKQLDQQIKQLAEKAAQVDLAQMNSADTSERVKELEGTCDDLRRRLAEERTVQNNFKDLLSALKGQFQETSNERDNLRDKVVPQLRARVEGLEAEAAEHANMTYEQTKMQQQIQSLQKENDTLRTTAKTGADTPENRLSRAMSGGNFGGLSRSNSVATALSRNQRPPNIGLSRSNSVKSSQVESREVLADKLKDAELQRDALHGALKNLLERHELQNRETEKRIKVLEAERDRLLSPSLKRGGFEREVANLRTEINVLRRRAEDALDQKWLVENGLLGLKMDLDRAEAEITMLRDLLNENDILIPPSMARSSAYSNASGAQGSLGAPVTSESLQNAYNELKESYTEALERIKALETDVGSVTSDERTQLALKRLEQSLAAASTERDAAQQEAQTLRNRLDDMVASESKNIETERALADELTESARRVEELAAQVGKQLSINAELRQRLADTVIRGDNDRKANSERITDLQTRLKNLEEQLVAAQTASEERVARHEEEVAALREAHNAHLARRGSAGMVGLRSPGLKSPMRSPRPALLSPSSPMFPQTPRTPRLPPSMSFEDETQMTQLRERVKELEQALSDTEVEMQEVVAKMSTAQIEVLNLQEEREAAVRETRRLQKIIEKEQVKSFEERFRTLASTA